MSRKHLGSLISKGMNVQGSFYVSEIERRNEVPKHVVDEMRCTGKTRPKSKIQSSGVCIMQIQ
jgi:hypothetical protein